MSLKITPSILSADFTRLGEQVSEAISGGADAIHIDVMDGRFVPNLTMGPLVVSALKPITAAAKIPLHVHLMVEKPESLIPDFARAGADTLIVHVETCPHLHRTVQQIRELGMRPGVTLNPATSLVTLEEILPDVVYVLVMSVNPGFGGQSYISTSTNKIFRLRQMLNERGLHQVDLAVDGGIKTDNAAQIVSAGANVLVAGSGIYKGEGSVAENIAALRRAASWPTAMV